MLAEVLCLFAIKRYKQNGPIKNRSLNREYRIMKLFIVYVSDITLGCKSFVEISQDARVTLTFPFCL